MTRGVFRKMTDTKGTFHAKRSTIEDRNGMDLTEAEDITRGHFDFSFVILHCSLTFLVIDNRANKAFFLGIFFLH